MSMSLAHRSVRACLMAGACITSGALPGQVLAQTPARVRPATVTFDIAAQPLDRALRRLAEQSGVQIGYAPGVVEGRQGAALRGALTVEQALTRLLSDSGLGFRFTSAQAVVVETLPDAAGGVRLGTLRVGGGTDGAPGGRPGRRLETAAGDGRSDAELEAGTYRGVGTPAYISADRIQRTRGSSPGDFLSGIAGVTNGENRNSGALDVNIRGLQGQGRVPVVIDGAMQESTVYRGYAGMAGRTYLDPDLIGGISIEKGPSMAADAAGAVGGILRARTLNAGDIVAPDGRWGVLVRGGLTGNNSPPPPAATVGGSERAIRNFDRPDALDLRGRNGSIALAYRTDAVDLVGAVAQRRNGNYYAGSKGGIDQWEGGANRFGHGEQVINTSQDNTSYLLRGVLRPGAAHTLDVSYMRYDSLFGEMKPSQLMYGDTPYQTTSDVTVDTYTARYRFKPSGSLIDLRADLWATTVDSFVVDPIRFGDGDNSDRFAATLSRRRGVTLSNTSRLSGGFGTLALGYGLAYDHERFGKSDRWERMNAEHPDAAWPARQGWRRQYSGFVNAEYKPAAWATLTSGVRYIDAVVQDKTPGTSRIQGGRLNRDTASGWAPTVSALIEPVRGLQLYARYAEALRAASPFEATEGFSGQVDPYSNLRPEHSHSTEAGVSYQTSGLIADGDLLQIKAGYFGNEVTDYITLGNELVTAPSGNSVAMNVITNIPKVSMRGYEVSARYDIGAAYIEVSGTEYTDIQSCYRATPDARIRCYEGMPTTSQSWFVNHIPPKRALYATAGGRMFDERLSIGARYSHVERVPAFDLLDLFGSFDLSPKASIGVSVDNVFDKYYVDALSLGRGVGLLASPGRTVRINLTGRLGDGNRRRSSSRGGRERAVAQGLVASPLVAFDGDWSGPYVGVDTGATIFASHSDTTAGDGSSSAVAVFEGGDFSAHGMTGGLHAGYNFQSAGGLVYGIEIGGDLSRARLQRGIVARELDATRYDPDQILQANYSYRYSAGGSARLRVGQSVGRALFYGTGGIALVDERQTRAQHRSTSASAANPFGFTTLPIFSETVQKTRIGLSLGAGTEVAFSNRLSLRGEYLFGQFGETIFAFDRAIANINRSFTSGGKTTRGGADVTIGRDAKNRLQTHGLRVGLNYRF